MNKIAVSEFFYSLQGEGRTVGIPAVFLRLAGCNLMCGGKGTELDGQLHDGATWRCDTIEVWLKGQTTPFELLVKQMEEEVEAISRMREGAHLVITGGEPLLQAKRMLAFLEYLEKEEQLIPIVEVETNGTIIPSDELNNRVHFWNCSPKLTNSGMPAKKRLIPAALRWFFNNSKTMIKLVITTMEDWREIEEELLQAELIQKNQLVLMPAAASREELFENSRLVSEICIKHGIRMGTRLHVTIWDKLTGV